MKQRFPDDVKLRVLKLANSGKSTTQICAITKIPESSVRKLLREYGVTASHGSSSRISPTAKSEFIRMHTEEHMNASEIARNTGFSETSVRRVLRDYEKWLSEKDLNSGEITLLDAESKEATDIETVDEVSDSCNEDNLSFDVNESIYKSIYIRKLHTVQKYDKLNDVFSYDLSGCGNANHIYAIHPYGDDPSQIGEHECYAYIRFQNGPRNNDVSEHGILDADLLEIVRDRLKAFQSGDYACDENANALRHIEEALLWMNKRVEDRSERGVLGTNNK